MKRLRVAAMAQEREELLRALLRLGCVEISEPDHLADGWPDFLRRSGSALAETKGEAADAASALDALRRFAQTKDGLFIQRRPVKESDFLSVDAARRAKEACGRINGLTAKLTTLDAERERLTAQSAALAPWKTLDFPLETRDTAHAVFRLGVCPAGTDVGALRTELSEAAAAELYPAGADKTQQYLLLVCHRADETAAMELLRRAGFSVTSFPSLTGTPAENLAALDGSLAENAARREEVLNELTACGGMRDELRLYADRLAAEQGGVREEAVGGEDHRRAAVLRRADALERRFVDQRGAGFLIQRGVHVGVDHARADAVDAHARRADLLGQRLGQADDGGFRGGIGHLARCAHLPPH